MKIFIALFLLVSSAFSQEFIQRDIKVITPYNYNESADKFQVKFVGPTGTVPPQDSIFNDVETAFNESAGRWSNRYSIFSWKIHDHSNMLFYTLTRNLVENQAYHYTVFDTTPEQKGVFYITENIFRSGQVIVYCEGVKQPSYKDSVKVLVSIFSLSWQDPLDFNFYQNVARNTSFKVVAGKNTSSTYLRVDMYQDATTFVKTVYSWSSVNALVAQVTTGIKVNRKQRVTFSLPNEMKFDIMGRKHAER